MISQEKPKSIRGPRIAIPKEDIDRLSRLPAAAMYVMRDVAEYLEH
jgi:hypothetical protein